jgi:cell division protein FtsB
VTQQGRPTGPRRTVGQRQNPERRRAGEARRGAEPRRVAQARRTAGQSTGTARFAGAARARPASRPAPRPAGSRAAAGGSALRTRAPQPHRLTGRATVLVLVLGALLLAYAYPVRVYLDQQAQIASLEASQAASAQRIRDLTEEAAKWSDDEYVKAQARKRLQMVLPGDTAYVIVDPSVAAQNPGADPNAGKATSTGPWYGKLWSSVRAADRPRPAS